ncbi:MAG: DUF1415 domain-containing protein [Burkholderiaceae bacterium]|nr:DUF1415 domain-containing protein [Burkholderiaceae bacterium]
MIPTQISAQTIAPVVIQDTQRWLERAVIGLNLCPFAKSVHVKGLIHYAVSDARTAAELLVDLKKELNSLVAGESMASDTTLLIAPYGVQDFLEFNDLLGKADKLLARMGLEGVIQIASLHPHYQFAGTQVDDITNFTNRSPYPTLHLLREASIDQAVAAFPEAETIFEANMQTMQRLGRQGWADLGVDATVPIKP